MSEYESLRDDIGIIAESLTKYAQAVNRYVGFVDEQVLKLWSDNAELRDEINAVSNRVEALTRAVMAEPADVAQAIVNHANHSTLRSTPGRIVSTYYYVCDECGSLVTLQDAPIPEGEAWECDECGNDAAWEFTDKRAAFEHGAHIEHGKARFRSMS